MKSIVVSMVVFVLLLAIGGGALANTGVEAAGGNEKQSSSPGGVSGPGKTRDSFSREFLNAYANQGFPDGSYQSVSVFIDQEKDEAVGDLRFFQQYGRWVDCGGYSGFRGWREEGFGGGVLEVNATQSATATGYVGVSVFFVDDCLEIYVFQYNYWTQVEATVTGESDFFNRYGACYDVGNGTQCTKETLRGSNGPSLITEGGFTLGGWGTFGQSKASFTFTPN